MTTKTVQFNSDAQGNWSFQVQNDLAPGPHTITVQDANGNKDQAVIYIVKQPAVPLTEQPTQFADRVQQLMPGAFAIAAAALSILIIVLIINNLRLARRAGLEIAKTQKTHVLRNAIIFCVVVLVLLLGIGLYLNRETNFLAKYFPAMQKNAVVKVTGRLADPLTMQGIGGVDLSSGDTSIRTISSGQFVFSAVNPNQGIRATSPNLLRAFVILPDKNKAEQDMTVFFDINLLNQMVRVADLESRLKFSAIYDYLPVNIQEKISREDYAKNYNPAYLEMNLNDQEIYLVETKMLDNYNSGYDVMFNKVAELTLAVNGAKVKYYFASTNDGWKLVE